MKITPVAVAIAVFLTGCTTSEYPSAGLQPIPGSITYNGQPRTKLTKAPIGSTFTHQFFGELGERVYETYRIEPDRSLKLVNRRRSNLFFPDP